MAKRKPKRIAPVTVSPTAAVMAQALALALRELDNYKSVVAAWACRNPARARKA